MSEWSRGGRDDDRRRFREDDRSDWGRTRWPGQETRGEQRSFEERSRSEYRGQDRRDEQRGDRNQSYGSPYGDYTGQRYAGRSAQDYGGQGYRGQDYRGQTYRGEDYRSSDQRRPYYGGQQGDQAYGGRQAQERWRRDQSGITGDNEPLQRVGDGDADRGMWSEFGRGEHRGRGPKNYTRSDERIREDVNDRLSDDPWLDATEIEVMVATCEVTLSGAVDSREDRRRAEDLAEQVSGVKHVQNNLRVESNRDRHGAEQAGSGQARQSRGGGSQLR